MKTKIRLSRAWPLANKIQMELEPACEEIEIVGVLARKHYPNVISEIGEIEMAILPRLCPEGTQLSLFEGEPDQPISALDLLLDKLIRDKGNIRRGKDNSASKKSFQVIVDENRSEIPLILHLATPEQWENVMARRAALLEINEFLKQ